MGFIDWLAIIWNKCLSLGIRDIYIEFPLYYTALKILRKQQRVLEPLRFCNYDCINTSYTVSRNIIDDYIVLTLFYWRLISIILYSCKTYDVKEGLTFYRNKIII